MITARYFADGYIILRTKDDEIFGTGQIAEHRYIIAKRLGRKLKSNEVVHHKNENRSDNRIKNLELIMTEEHAHRHHYGKKNPEKSLRAKQRWAKYREIMGIKH